MSVLEDFGYRVLSGRLAPAVKFVACYVTYEGRPAPRLPARFGSVDAALKEWVYGIGPGPPRVAGSVADFFQRTLNLTLEPVGGERIWVVRLATDEHSIDGKLRAGAELRGLVKSRLAAAMAAEGFPLSALDLDKDSVVESPDGQLVPPELLVLALDNLNPAGGQTGGTSPWSVDIGSGCVWEGSVSGLAVGAGVTSMCHELAHQFGTKDLYGAGRSRNSGFTTMAASPSDPDSKVRLDPWHEMQFGVTTPLVFDLTTPGEVTIDHAGGDNNQRAVLLTDPARRFEGYLVQLRLGPQDPIDTGGPNGWCVWHVAVDASTHGMLTFPSQTLAGGLDASINILGSPDLRRGDGETWPDTTTTPELRWWDGAETGFALSFDRVPGSRSGTVLWQRVETSWRHHPAPMESFPLAAVPRTSAPGLTLDPATGWPVVAARTTAGRMRIDTVLDPESLMPRSVPMFVESAEAIGLSRTSTDVVAAYLSPGGRVLVDFPPYFETPSDCEAENAVGSPAVTMHGDEIVVAWRVDDQIRIGLRGPHDPRWRHETVRFADQFAVPQPGTSPALVTTMNGDAEGTCFLAWTGGDALVRIRRRGSLRSGSWVEEFPLDFGIRVPAVLTLGTGFATMSSPALAVGPDKAVWVAVQMAARPSYVAYGRAPAALGGLEPAVLQPAGTPPGPGYWRPLRREVELGPMTSTPAMTGDPGGLKVAWLPSPGSPVRLGTLRTTAN